MTERKSYLQTEGDVNLSESRQKWNEQIDHTETKDALKADSDHFLHQALSTPCLDVLASAKGIRITNLSGQVVYRLSWQ